MRALQFETDNAKLIDYVVNQIRLAREGDVEAEDYINYLWDHDGDLIEEAMQDYYWSDYYADGI